MRKRTNPRPLRRTLAALALLAPLFLTGCRSTCDDYWSFPVTRAVYGESQPTHQLISDTPALTGSGAVVFLGILAIPLVLDLVIFPVTAIHDVWVD